MLRKVRALLASEEIILTLSTVVIGLAVGNIRKIADHRQKQIAQLNRAIAEGYAQLEDIQAQLAAARAEARVAEELNGGIED